MAGEPEAALRERGIPPEYPLGDAWEDGGIEEHAWVPVAMAATPEAAVRALAASDWSDCVHQLEQDGMKVIATGERSWHRVSDCSGCDGEGEDPRVVGDPFGPRPACEACGGDGVQSNDGGGIAWTACNADTPGAVEFWDLEVTDAA